MELIRKFLLFWYHFIIGDDWRIAFGVVVGFGFIATLSHYYNNSTIWWIMPLVIPLMMALSFFVTLFLRKNKTKKP